MKITDIYIGVVVDNKDPKKLNRVKVRVKGLHPDSDDFDIGKLPFADVVGDLSSAFAGIGVSQTLRQGTPVYVTFLNSNFLKPLVLGQCFVITKKDAGNWGDPDGVLPENIKNFQNKDEQEVDRGDRPPNHPLSDEEYPNAVIFETPAHHTVIMTEKEIRINHNSETEILIKEDGSLEILCQKDLKYTVKGNVEYEVEGDMKFNVKGKLENDLKGDFTVKSQGGKIETQSGLDLKSNGITNIKGQMINLN